jgi:uncharacterized membrane protein YkvA (DUF1232 family)
MALPGGLNLTLAIAGVCANDVDAVVASLPGKLEAARPLLMGGKLRRLRDLLRDVRTLFDILTDRTFSVPWRTTAAIVFALGYFVLSFDLIPDVVPVLGFLDDALVVAEVVYLLSGDLRRYREHRARTATGGQGERASAERTDTSASATDARPVASAA